MLRRNPALHRVLAAGLLILAAAPPLSLGAAGESIVSPDGRIAVVVNDTAGLRYRVTLDGDPVVVDSRLGLDFAGGFSFGRTAVIEHAERTAHDGTWDNPFGQHRTVGDHYRELKLQLREHADAPSRFNLIVRAYDQGVAFRYEIPVQPGLEDYVVTNERTEFIFPSDLNCWAGGYSDCAECQYLEKPLSKLTGDVARPHVLPLLVKLPHGYAAIAEADLLDWAGMFVTAAGPGADGTPRPGARVALAPRKDGRGLVVGHDRRVSPWRVIQLARKAKDLVASEFIPTLSTPSQLTDTSWIKPGITAWDSWWTGLNPTQSDYKGLNSRGDTRSHKEYIEFAAEMGFPYQLIDWFWYEPMNNPKADLTKPAAHVDLPGLVEFARERHVRLMLWIDSHDLSRQGFENVFVQVGQWGFAGVKIDFMNSDSQETVRWYADVLAAAARHRLMVDLHGAYKPTSLARTWPNYITQEGVLGNEYNKIHTGLCTTLHTITLPFTRGLLGPMDFTPGGFLNRTAADFKVTQPAEVVGTRARQLAETVVYFSPQLCLCDSPENYRGQPGVEFFRGLPTVWDDTVVLSAEVAQHVVIARRSGSNWYLAAMNGDAPLTLKVPLKFLGTGAWSLHAFADTAQSAAQPEKISDTTTAVNAADSLELTLAAAGGYVAALSPMNALCQFHPNNPPIMTDTFLKSTKAAVLASLLVLAASAFAQDGTIYPLEAPAEPNAIPLGTGGVKDQPARESWFRQWGEPMVRNVSDATLTPFLPDPAKANGTAVIVAPGGGFRWLSINNEGWKIAKALNARGVAAFVLKYRLIPTPPTLAGLKESMNHTFATVTPAASGASDATPPTQWKPPARDLSNQQADAEAAYALILKNAEKWHVDTRRIGMIGFSAGAGLTMHCELHSKTMKLAFIAPIYGGLGAVEVPKDAPPLFVALAIDDPLMFHGDFGLIKSWWEAKRPVEFHLYQNGGHGFGMGYPNHPTYWWFEVFTHWLDINGFLKAGPNK